MEFKTCKQEDSEPSLHNPLQLNRGVTDQVGVTKHLEEEARHPQVTSRQVGLTRVKTVALVFTVPVSCYACWSNSDFKLYKNVYHLLDFSDTPGSNQEILKANAVNIIITPPILTPI